MTGTYVDGPWTGIDLPDEVAFVLKLDALKELERQNPLSVGERRERVAEHSWHVAIAAILLQDRASAPIDVGRAALLAVVHDVVEYFVGDTFAFGSDTADKRAREHKAMEVLGLETDRPETRFLVELWREYEEQKTPEARFVRGLNTFLPIAHNFHNLEQSSWRKHNVVADQVRTRLEQCSGEIGDLEELGRDMIAHAEKLQYLK